MTWWCVPCGDDPDFSYTYETSFDTSHSFDTDVNYDKDVDVDVDIDVDLNVEGNSAIFNIDIQALGYDGATELNLTVVTAYDYSSIVATGYSVVA